MAAIILARTLMHLSDDHNLEYQALSIVYKISHLLGRTLELSDLAHKITEIFTGTLGIKEFTLLFMNEAHDALVVHTAYGFEDDEKIRGLVFKLGEGISGLVAQTKKSIVIQDTSNDSRYLHYKGKKLDDGSFASIPIIVAGEVVGVLNVSHNEKNIFTDSQVRLLEAVAGQIGLVYDRARLFMKVKELSVTDELTGIANRRHFQATLSLEFKRALRFSKPLALLMIDVDHFKKFNDTYGHVRGDQALKALARMIQEHIREVDTLARIGGEEFVLILPNSAPGEVQIVAEKIRKLVEEESIHSISTGGVGAQLTVSIGCAVYPDHAQTEEELINQADVALYQAKGSGRNRLVIAESSSIDTVSA